jgi:hypothetical protein
MIILMPTAARVQQRYDHLWFAIMQSLGIPQLFGSAVQRLAGVRQTGARSGDSNDERIAELFRLTHGGGS